MSKIERTELMAALARAEDEGRDAMAALATACGLASLADPSRPRAMAVPPEERRLAALEAVVLALTERIEELERRVGRQR